MESPFDDFLSTPGLRNDDYASEFGSPLIADDDDFGSLHNAPLFHDVGLFEPPSTSDACTAPPPFPSVHPDDMYTISPASPALDKSPPPP